MPLRLPWLTTCSARSKVDLGCLCPGAARAAAEMRDVITRTVETASALNDTSVALGVTTEALQELGYAAQLNGSHLSKEWPTGCVSFRFTWRPQQRGGEAAEVFRKLGVSVTEGGKLRAADAVLEDIAEKFKAMPDGARKVATAIDLFGKSGASLIPTLTVGREELVKLRREARGLGVVMTRELIESGDTLGDTWDKLKFAADGLRYTIASSLLTGINGHSRQPLSGSKQTECWCRLAWRLCFRRWGQESARLALGCRSSGACWVL